MGKAAVLAMKTKSRLSPRRYQSSTHLSFGLVWSSGCSCAPSAQERRGCLASSSVAYSASRGPRKLMPPGILGRDHQSRSLVRFNRTSPVRKNDWPRAPALTSPCAPGHIACRKCQSRHADRFVTVLRPCESGCGAAQRLVCLPHTVHRPLKKR